MEVFKIKETRPHSEVELPAERAGDRRYLSWQSSRISSRLVRVFQAVVFLCAAASLSAFASSPWSFFRTTASQNTLGHADLQTTDPASEYKDDVFPFRQPAPWDISTDFSYPRVLEYDVEEGTWLRLDVHPKTGDIVFDMAGDLYCLPASRYKNNADATRALPILVGIPHDSDPHFSPGGDKLVFRSDAELGVENIWVTKWTGCEAMDVRPAASMRADLSQALDVKQYEDDLLAKGVAETADRKQRRLLREGRLGAKRVTNETWHWVSDARFHPSGEKVVATKWYYSQRSLGSGEGWEFTVPDLDETVEYKVAVGAGKRLVGRTLPLGWTAEDYAEQQIGPEQFIWAGNDKVIYSKNVRDPSTFQYSKDVHKGIYAIFSTNLTTGRTETLVSVTPGGATRPELSRDGRTLAFVRRVRDKEALVLKDLISGTIYNIWYGLTYDAQAISAPMGTYPSFAFSPNDDAVIIWAAGKIYNVPLAVNAFGEKVSGGTPTPILFTAHIEKRIAETRHEEIDVLGLETQDIQRLHAFKELSIDGAGKRAIFQAAGVTYIQELGTGAPAAQRVPVLFEDAAYYAPSFISGADDLIIHARWSNVNFTTFELVNVTSGDAYEVGGLPVGRYYSPVLCECRGLDRQIAFVKTGGDLLTGNVVATAGEGLYVGRINLPSSSDDKITIRNAHLVSTDIDTDEHIKLQFVENNRRLLVQQSDSAVVINLEAGPNEYGDYHHTTVVTGKATDEIAIAPKTREGKSYVPHDVAFVDLFHVYFAPSWGVRADQPVWSKPGNATQGLARLSLDGGHDIVWSRDGKKLFWLLGPYLHSLEISKLSECSSAIKNDAETFGISCVKNLLEFQEIFVYYDTDIRRLKDDIAAVASATANENADVLVIANATILTMESGDLFADYISNGAITIKAGIISSIGSLSEDVIPQGAYVIDAEGGYVIPGFIDAHAHWSGTETLHPATSWEMEAFLAYGVTTMHNPSLHNVLGFVERARVESGLMVGPRIFQTGMIIYGAGSLSYHQDIADTDEAHSALVRIKVEGGPASFSYKNYNLPSRASRQRLLLASKNLSMICVPEGGMNFDWDQTYIVDGMTTIEHNIPIPVLYDDILTLYALSGTAATPTHIVNYGGVHGEQFVWADEDVPNDPKLRKFTRHDILEQVTESTSRPLDSYALVNTSASIAKMVDRGLLALIGAHGEPPIGLNYHEEMYFAAIGGLDNYEVIRAATSSAAQTFGLSGSLGTISSGKLADVLIYPAGVDLLQDDIRRTRELRYVVRGGRVWDAEKMVEEWPIKGRKQITPPFNAD